MRSYSGFLILLILAMFAGCRGEQETVRSPGVMTGTVYVIGNEPFTGLGLQTDDGTMHRIEKDSSGMFVELQKLQGRYVRVRFRRAGTPADSTSITIDNVNVVHVP